MGQTRKRAADNKQEESLHQHENQPEQEKLTPYELQRQRLCVLPVLKALRIPCFSENALVYSFTFILS